VLDDVNLLDYRIRVGAGNTGIAAEAASRFHDGFQRLGSQDWVLHVPDGETLLDEVHENVELGPPRHGQVDEGPVGGGLHAEHPVGFGIAFDAERDELRFDQPLDEFHRPAHYGTMDREPVINYKQQQRTGRTDG